MSSCSRAELAQRLAVRVARRLAELQSLEQLLHRPASLSCRGLPLDRLLRARQHVLELGQRLRQLLLGRRDAMVRVLALHEADALALDRVRDHAGRPALVDAPTQPVHDLAEVVAVDLADVPPH